MTVTEATTRTLDAPGATITYDVRPGGDGSQPPLMLIGSPMGAAGFVTLSSHFPERTVVTYDPRGAERSGKDDPSTESNPEQHADDLHRIIQAVGGPVDLFASSGGAVNALALVAAHPDDVRTLVAHEPPLCSVLPDQENAQVGGPSHQRLVRAAWLRRGHGALHGDHRSPRRVPGRHRAAAHPRPGPVRHAGRGRRQPRRRDAPPDTSSARPTTSRTSMRCARASTRIIMAAGDESQGEMANRGAYGVAKELGTEVVVFPSHHGGFLGGEYGWAGEPDAFAAKLREVLG